MPLLRYVYRFLGILDRRIRRQRRLTTSPPVQLVLSELLGTKSNRVVDKSLLRVPLAFDQPNRCPMAQFCFYRSAKTETFVWSL